MADWPVTEVEERLGQLFKELEKAFKKVNKTKNADKLHNMMKDITNKLKEAKS